MTAAGGVATSKVSKRDRRPHTNLTAGVTVLLVHPHEEDAMGPGGYSLLVQLSHNYNLNIYVRFILTGDETQTYTYKFLS